MTGAYMARRTRSVIYMTVGAMLNTSSQGGNARGVWWGSQGARWTDARGKSGTGRRGDTQGGYGGGRRGRGGLMHEGDPGGAAGRGKLKAQEWEG
eukprot:1182194-Prorocentrum_minimum.AAC.5